MKPFMIRASVVLSALMMSSGAYAFCGYYVAKADASLYNKASQVIIARDGNRTVLSMFNDYQGEMQDFAMVVPVPAVIKKEQVNIGSANIFKRVDDFTAPRLVEYFDNPCEKLNKVMAMAMSAPVAEMMKDSGKRLGVKIEEQFTIGEYDIVILSAKESDGLMTWLKESGYKIPKKAESILGAYINQGLKFFVAKVNLKEQAKSGYQFLRPLQFAYESERFMLPIRLGTLNAHDSPQDLLAYIFTRKGRVEVSNYRTLKMPTDAEIPVVYKDDFKNFFRAMFENQWKRENGKVVFTEHFWDINWCDPCSSEPLTPDELRQAGVFWWNEGQAMPAPNPPGIRPMPRPMPMMIAQPQGQTKITRLHVRYTAESFPEDLMLTETGDTANFQVRYILRHPYDIAKNPNQCQADDLSRYHESLIQRRQKEAETTANLTGWDINTIREKMGADPIKPTINKAGNEKWWGSLWDKK